MADSGTSIAVDANQNTYVTGATSSYDFPLVSPFLGTGSSEGCAFVIKLDATTTPLYSTFLCGTQYAKGVGISADSSGNAYVTGAAESGFPLVNPIQNLTGLETVFVSKFNPDGSSLVYSTFLLGKSSDHPLETTQPVGIAVDGSGRAYVLGWHTGASVPLVSPIQNWPTSSTQSGFVSVLDSAGASLVFSTYFGSSKDYPAAIGTDSNNNIYVAGWAQGIFPILNAANGTYIPFMVDPQLGLINPAQVFQMKISLGNGLSLSLPGAVDLSLLPTRVGQSKGSGFAVANTSASGDITISDIQIAGDFSQTNNCLGVLPAASVCGVSFEFQPTVGGARRGTVTITDSAPGSPHIVNLIGIGGVPKATLNPTSLVFSSQAVGTASAKKTVTLTNSGEFDLSLLRISAAGDFSESNNCGTILVPSRSCTISVMFTPTVSGARAGSLTIEDNAPDSPQTVALTGTGVDASPGLVVSPGDSGSATVNAGSPATYSLSVGGAGLAGTVNLSCTGAPRGAACSVPASEAINAATPTTFTATVTTTARTLALLNRPGSSRSSWLLASVLVTGLLVVPTLRRRRLILGTLASMMLALLCSCGGGNSEPPPNQNGTPAGTYTLTVTATMGGKTQNINLTLKVN